MTGKRDTVTAVAVDAARVWVLRSMTFGQEG